MSLTVKSEFFNHNSKPSYALMSTISGHGHFAINDIMGQCM